jgi:hypothetical protein
MTMMRGGGMFFNSQDLQQLPIWSEDKVAYTYVDGLLDKAGQVVESLILRRQTAMASEDYVVPTSCIGVISRDDAIYLNRTSEALAGFHLSMDFPQYEAISALGVDINDPHWDGKDYYSIHNLLQYKVKCLNGRVGQMSDIFFHPTTFTVHYFAIDIHRGFTRKWTFITSKWLEKIDWSGHQAYLNVSKEMVTSGPLYRPREPMTDILEQALTSYAQRIRRQDKVKELE